MILKESTDQLKIWLETGFTRNPNETTCMNYKVSVSQIVTQAEVVTQRRPVPLVWACHFVINITSSDSCDK